MSNVHPSTQTPSFQVVSYHYGSSAFQHFILLDHKYIWSRWHVCMCVSFICRLIISSGIHLPCWNELLSLVAKYVWTYKHTNANTNMGTNTIQIYVQIFVYNKCLHAPMSANFFDVQNKIPNNVFIMLKQWHKRKFQTDKKNTTKELRFIYFSTTVFTLDLYWEHL